MRILYSSQPDDGDVQVEIKDDDGFYTFMVDYGTETYYYQEFDEVLFLNKITRVMCDNVRVLPVSLYSYVIRSLPYDLGLHSYAITFVLTCSGGTIASSEHSVMARVLDEDSVHMYNAQCACEVLNIPQAYDILSEKYQDVVLSAE